VKIMPFIGGFYLHHGWSNILHEFASMYCVIMFCNANWNFECAMERI
jgi:hypothetical protein